MDLLLLFVSHKMRPLKWKIMSVSTNNLSRFFAEHAYTGMPSQQSLPPRDITTIYDATGGVFMPNQGILPVNIASSYACYKVWEWYWWINLPHILPILGFGVAANKWHQLHHNKWCTQALIKGGSFGDVLSKYQGRSHHQVPLKEVSKVWCWKT